MQNATALKPLDGEKSELRKQKERIGWAGFAAASMVVCLGLISTYSIVLLFIGLLPGFAAKMVDNDPVQSLSKSVISLNISVLFFYLMNIVGAGINANQIAINKIGDPYTWLVVYSACATGWLLDFYVPRAVVAYQLMKAYLQIRELQAEVTTLEEAWGKDVTKGLNL
ncbi:MAG: hypothetical protein JSS50_03460 [Proteobacteria bacterium]|nr:hypothetical protein [Pseudomonadota bacterium]